MKFLARRVRACKLRDIQQHDTTFRLPDNALAKGNKLVGTQNGGHRTAHHGKCGREALILLCFFLIASLDPKAKPEKKQKNINKTVEKLLKKYPPQVKK